MKRSEVNLQSQAHRSHFSSNFYPEDLVKEKQKVIGRMFGNLTTPFISINDKGTILFANEPFRSKAGFKAGIEGQPLRSVCGKNSAGLRILSNLMKVFLSGKAEELKEEYSFPALKGTLKSINFPIRDNKGTLIGAGKIIITETQAAQTELEEKIENRVTESNFMNSLTKFSAGLGHDVANILLPVDIRLRLMEKKLSLTLNESELKSVVIDELSNVRCSLGYLKSLSDDLRNISTLNGDMRCITRVDLDLWRRQTNSLLRTFLPEFIDLRMEVEPISINLGISSAQLTQIVFNLVQNSCNAMKNRSDGEISVTLKDMVSEKALQLCILDNGPGMTAAVKNKCFEPFFSTKLSESSFGLGLTLVQMIVHAAGGNISLHSKEHFGTTFEIMIPYH